MSIIIDNIEKKLCLLDTNIISEIIKNQEAKKNLKEKIENEDWIPMFTVESVFEIMKDRKDLKNGFIDLFDDFPFQLTVNFNMIFLQELLMVKHKNLFYFNNSGYRINNFKENIESLILTPEVVNLGKKWRSYEQEETYKILEYSKNNNFHLKNKSTSVAKNYIENNFERVFDYCLEELMIDRLINNEKREWNLDFYKYLKESKTLIKYIDMFPSIKIQMYSTYFRMLDKKYNPQEITDVKIIVTAPYMDIVIVESYQANILNKIKKENIFSNNISVYTIRDLRKNFS